jgi:vitellogenic carboxypeptidase-like protein
MNSHLLISLLLFLLPLTFAGPLRKNFLKNSIHWRPSPGADPGSPLFLTPYIEKGEIQKARELSAVKGIGTHPSYSGFFTVNSTYNSNMFFWYFPAQSGDAKAPLLLWLQGGPGGSSLFGLFVENGPLMVDEHGEVQERNITWNSDYAMVFFDNPVGTGYSFTGNDAGYSTNEVEVGENLYRCLVQFLTVFSELKDVDFYITGESYAGKYIPALGYTIHMANSDPKKNFTVNFKGLLLGDGLVDPVNMFAYSDLLFQYGMLDSIEAQYFKSEEMKAVAFIQNGQYLEAFEIFDMLLNGDLFPYPSYYKNVTGSDNYDNILRCVAPASFGYYNGYVTKDEVRKAIHVGNLTYNDGSEVEKKLLNDVMQSTAKWLALLMDNYKVLLYNGQLDVIVAGPLTEAYLQKLSWSGQQEYLVVNKTIWKVNPTDTEVAGYARTVKNFVQLIVRGAGHILPYDQPERALDMVRRFISGKGF